MARRLNQGTHEVDIPISEIMAVYGEWANEIVKAVSDELLKEVRAKAQAAFKDRSGKLRKSIRKKKSKFNEDTYIVGAFAPHAHLVEHGTKVRVDSRGRVSGHMPASPFLAPAEESVRTRLAQIVNKVVVPSVVVKK